MLFVTFSDNIRISSINQFKLNQKIFTLEEIKKYINGYIDNAMGMIHDNVSTILQLKTQLRIATEIVPEKDALIASLQEQLDECNNASAGLTKSVEEAGTIKASYEAIKNKV